MLCHVNPEVLISNAKGLENFKSLKNAAKDCGSVWFPDW
ncbi:hypothetical protein BAE44_0025638 [Dichanthelium oligosanthes]|uniref:Uncharacterized protein n=1 Tax=Dichanthelium oligosanthes TaxID=888268 RepID=A0A1E5UKD2_9POAL|nr:hypothetical protein BAE44_0025638 [Dichanthelium oligosanthes]